MIPCGETYFVLNFLNGRTWMWRRLLLLVVRTKIIQRIVQPAELYYYFAPGIE